MAGFNNDVVFAQVGMRIGDITILSSEQASIQFPAPGADVALLINNTSNAPSSNSLLTLRVEGTLGGDPYTRWQVGSSDSWAIGITNDAGNPNRIFCSYSADGDASPSNLDNLPWAADVIAGVGSVRCRSFLSVASGGEQNGGAVLFNIQNVETDAASDAQINIQVSNGVAGGGGGNATLVWTGPADNWAAGVDKDLSNQWRLGTDPTGAFLTANAVIVATNSGEVTLPRTPGFSAFLTATATDVTGDGTTFNISANAFTENFDINADFAAATGIFTAPVTGRYVFHAGIALAGVVAGNTNGQFSIITSNRGYLSWVIDWGNLPTSTVVRVPLSTFADMDAADTAFLQIRLDNDGVDEVDVVGTAQSTTWFTGFLAT